MKKETPLFNKNQLKGSDNISEISEYREAILVTDLKNIISNKL